MHALVDEKLTKDQVGFRPGRSCAGQLLNLTQHIEDGYERNMLTGAACVDLSAAYDTVQHRLMIRKLLDMTGDIDLCQVIRGLLSNRRFFVQLNDKKSRWGSQKNGLPQGSVLAPLLFNINYIQTINLCLRTAAGSYMQMTSVSPPNRVDISLNDTCRIITGCLKATPIPCLYALAGIE